MTNAGESLNPGLLLKSRCVFKLCLECFHQGFLFCYLRRTPLGNVESSVESVDSCLGKRVQESQFSVALLRSHLLMEEVELISGWVQAS